jgi:hypothetical protein
MRTLLGIFLCAFLYMTSQAQTLRAGRSLGELWMHNMNVREITVNKEIICNTQQVIWGNSADTIGFYFNNKEIYFWPAYDRNLTEWIRTHSKPEDQYFLMQDKTGLRYTVRRYSTDQSFCFIIVSHAPSTLPSYMFGFGFKVCD